MLEGNPALRQTLSMSISPVILLISASASLIAGTPIVMDGDTIRIGEERIRLKGIDAPESAQSCQRTDGSEWRCGTASTQALSNLIAGRAVRCEMQGKDRYNRSLGTCWLGDIDINGWMVSHGWAVAYRRYSIRYISNEDDARLNQRNLWSGAFEMPWQWRTKHRH